MFPNSAIPRQPYVKVEHDRTGSLELGPFKDYRYTPPPPMPAPSKSFILTWEAYDKALELCKDVKIRLGYNPWFKSDFVYMARKGFTEDPSVIKYSLMEAHRLKCFLDNILSQISKCESRFELIKFFENDHMRATEKMDFNDKLKFWQTVDLEMYHLTAKITYNEPQADYVLHLLNRVSRKVSEAHNMWPGAYIMVSGTSAIKGLHSFLQDALKKSESAVPKVPEQE